MNSHPSVLGFAAFSGTGKTTLLTRLIPLLLDQELRLGLIKHGHHRFEIDQPGNDSYTLRQAGAIQVLVSSNRRTVLMAQHYPEPSLEILLQRLNTQDLDLILVEGFKRYPISKIELHRPSLGHPLLCLQDPAIIAVATDAPLGQDLPVPMLNLNDPKAIAYFIRERFQPSSS